MAREWRPAGSAIMRHQRAALIRTGRPWQGLTRYAGCGRQHGRRRFGSRCSIRFYGIGLSLCASVVIGLGSVGVRPSYAVLAICVTAAAFVTTMIVREYGSMRRECRSGRDVRRPSAPTRPERRAGCRPDAAAVPRRSGSRWRSSRIRLCVGGSSGAGCCRNRC